jgi:dTDP-4-dehydrorhamnose 3,5-epimerase
MKIQNTFISGVKVIQSEPFKDERGYFARIFCRAELETIRKGIVIEQMNLSMTKKRGTIRGMHLQNPPYTEMKIVRCLKGSIFDVAVDLRKNSPTFLQYYAEILTAEDMNALVIPEGCAHGFQALENDIEMLYLHTNSYCKNAEETIRYDEPKVNIQWKLPAENISAKDLSAQYLTDNYKGIIL